MKKILILLMIFASCSKGTEPKPVEQTPVVHTTHTLKYVVSSQSNPITIKYGQYVYYSSTLINYHWNNNYTYSKDITEPSIASTQTYFLSCKNINYPNDTICVQIFIDEILKSQTKGIDSVYTSCSW